ncbi:MAG TPA: hypothetical protein VJ036_07080 [bacterium]|nr:hypothetical protein [bacterium]
MTRKDAWPLRAKPEPQMGWRWLKMDRHTLVKLGLLAGLGIILLVVGRLGKIQSSDITSPATPPSSSATANFDQAGLLSYQGIMEQQIENTLSQVSGAGQVLVQLSLEGGNRITLATNRQEEIRNTEEKEPAGSVIRANEEKRTEAQLVMARQGSVEHPVVVDEFLPQVRGVLVVAEGAKTPHVKEELSQAMQVLLALPAHKVKVLERERVK